MPDNAAAHEARGVAPADEVSIPKNIAIYITDQSHPSQRDQLPEGAIPGFAVCVYRLKGHRPTTRLEGMWCRSQAQAEQMAQEYARQYATMAACGWR
jgi:hypothetical protein